MDMEDKQRMCIGIILLLLLVIGICAGITIHRLNILNGLLEKAQESDQISNYYMVVMQKKGSTIRVWSKDKEHYLVIRKDADNGTITDYQNGEEKLSASDSKGKKVVIKDADYVPLETFTAYLSPENVVRAAMTSAISKTDVEGKECYEVFLKDIESTIIVEKDTGIVRENETEQFSYRLNKVTDADVQKPDLTGYEEW